MSSPWLWFASRACGVMSLVLLSTVVVLGALNARGPRLPATGAAVIAGLHRTLALGSTTFVAVHISTAVVDTYVDIGWISVVVPFTAGYQPVWVGVGTIAFDLFVIVMVTSVLRQRLSHRTWRMVHWLAYVFAGVAVLHGLMMAQTDEPAFVAVTAVCAAAMGVALLWRLAVRDADRRRRVEIDSGSWT